jgi:hypothetical protein
MLRLSTVGYVAMDSIGKLAVLVPVLCLSAMDGISAEFKAAARREPAVQNPPLTDSEYVMPGKFEWQPELSTEGPVSIMVNLSMQKLEVFRGGTLIARSSVSSGRPGHSTPVGTFTILEKELMHHSNLYHNAPMPFMQRLTWHGVALHAGVLPGSPASHGCIRLPSEFAKKLYEITSRGDEVTVDGKASEFRLPRVSQQKQATPKKAIIVNPPAPREGNQIASETALNRTPKTMRELEAEEVRIRNAPELTPEQRRVELNRVWSSQRALTGVQ